MGSSVIGGLATASVNKNISLFGLEDLSFTPINSFQLVTLRPGINIYSPVANGGASQKIWPAKYASVTDDIYSNVLSPTTGFTGIYTTTTNTYVSIDNAKPTDYYFSNDLVSPRQDFVGTDNPDLITYVNDAYFYLNITNSNVYRSTDYGTYLAAGTPELATWTNVLASANPTLHIKYVGSYYFVLTSLNVIYYSSDGITWTSYTPSGAGELFTDIVFYNSAYYLLCSVNTSTCYIYKLTGIGGTITITTALTFSPGNSSGYPVNIIQIGTVFAFLSNATIRYTTDFVTFTSVSLLDGSETVANTTTATGALVPYGSYYVGFIRVTSPTGGYNYKLVWTTDGINWSRRVLLNTTINKNANLFSFNGEKLYCTSYGNVNDIFSLFVFSGTNPNTMTPVICGHTSKYFIYSNNSIFRQSTYILNRYPNNYAVYTRGGKYKVIKPTQDFSSSPGYLGTHILASAPLAS